MKNNPHLGSDALAFIEAIVPDTPETRRVEQQELFRLALTQAMREVRKQAGLTQEQLAERLSVGQSWVSKLESINNDHTLESIITYFDALGAKLQLSMVLGEKVISVNLRDTVNADIFKKTK
jgi:predicted transcriptional regulator